MLTASSCGTDISHRLVIICASISSRLERLVAARVSGAGGDSNRSGSAGASSEMEGVGRLFNQLAVERHDPEEELSNGGEAGNSGRFLARGSAAMTNTSSETTTSLGSSGTGGTELPPKRELVEFLPSDCRGRGALRIDLSSKETLELGPGDPKAGALDARGVEGAELVSLASRGSGVEKRSKARRLGPSSSGSTASVTVDREARLAVELLGKSLEKRALPSERRRSTLRFDFFSTRAELAADDSDRVDEPKLCMVQAGDGPLEPDTERGGCSYYTCVRTMTLVGGEDDGGGARKVLGTIQATGVAANKARIGEEAGVVLVESKVRSKVGGCI